MIERMDKVLDGSGQPGLRELRDLLQELLDGQSVEGTFIGHQDLQARSMRVFRLSFAINGSTRTWIAKRLRPEIARRNELVAKRWLPAVGLSDLGPPLAGSVADRSGACVWHVYHDLGPHELDSQHPGSDAVRTAIEQIARMHTRFAEHPLLGEVRLHGGDLGMRFVESNVRDAIYALEACKASAPRQHLRDRLLRRLHEIRRELPQREQVLEEWGGPETLLHGDLWAINVFVMQAADGLHARLIDWDHAAVGQFSYDLSTFLLRFPREHRRSFLKVYSEEVARSGWNLPPQAELNALFETAEYARFANRVIWPAIALVMDHADWGFDALAEIDQWFEKFEPVLPAQ